MKKKILDFITKDWYKKLISLLLATALWFIIHAQIEKENTDIRIFNDVPIMFINQPEDLNLLEVSPQFTQVKYIGLKENLSQIYFTEPTCYVDLTGAKEGEGVYVVHLSQNFYPPPKVSYEIAHNTVRIKLMPFDQKEVSVIIDDKIELREGYEIAEIQHSPEQVTLEGPQSLLQDIAEVHTEPLSREDVYQDFYTTLNLELNDPHIRIKEETASIEVYVRVQKQRGLKKFHNIPVIVRGTRANTDVLNANELFVQSVTLSGNILDLNRINASDIIAYVDIQDVHVNATANLAVQIYVRGHPEVDIVEISNDTVPVSVQVR